MDIIKSETKEELYKMAAKSLLNLPVLSFLNDTIFELRSKLEQRRINDFVISFAKHLEIEFALNSDKRRLSTEEFSDLWNNVLLKVSRTRSAKKTELFRTLLTHHVVSGLEIDATEMYIQIIDKISEKQLLILDGLSKVHPGRFITLHEEIADLSDEIRTIQAERTREKKYIKDESKFEGMNRVIAEKLSAVEEIQARTSEFTEYQPVTYNCEPAEFYFLIHDLFNNGLIRDNSARLKAAPFTVIEVNEMGKEILKFLKNYGD